MGRGVLIRVLAAGGRAGRNDNCTQSRPLSQFASRDRGPLELPSRSSQVNNLTYYSLGGGLGGKVEINTFELAVEHDQIALGL